MFLTLVCARGFASSLSHCCMLQNVILTLPPPAKLPETHAGVKTWVGNMFLPSERELESCSCFRICFQPLEKLWFLPNVFSEFII